MMPDLSERSLVSVIIPTYNRAAMVVDAIDSVRRQTWGKTQIIVVDDGSTDDTVERLKGMKDVLLIEQQSKRQAAARNNGLNHAKGEYICTLDSDDIWNPDFLERCMEALQTLNADFVFANWIGHDISGKYYDSYFQKFYRWWDFPRTKLQGWRLMRPLEARAIYIDSCPSPSSSILFRREQIQHGWVEEMNIGDDWCLTLDLIIKRECNVAFTMQPLWVKQVAFDNICDKRDFVEVKQNLHILDVTRMKKRFLPLLTRQEKARMNAHVGFHQYGMAKIEARAKHYGIALEYAISSIRNMLVSSILSLPDTINRVHTLSKRFRPEPDLKPEMLKNEGIVSVEGMVFADHVQAHSHIRQSSPDENPLSL